MKISKKNLASVLLAATMTVGILPMSQAESNIISYVGNNRTQTSIESAKKVNSDIVVLANGYNFADSLSAFNIASSQKAKLILVNNNSNIKSEIESMKPKKVYVVGGESVISSELIKTISDSVKDIERIAGSNRYKTNQKTLEIGGFNKVGVADGRKFPDALAASGLLASKKMGLLLVNGSSTYTTNYTVAYTFGGSNSVRQDGGIRLAGKNRYETNRLINSEIGPVDKAVFTYGEDFPDALSAINIIIANPGASVLLIGNSLTTYQQEYLNVVGEKIMIGGSIKQTIVQTIKDSIKENDNKQNDDKQNDDKQNDDKQGRDKEEYVQQEVKPEGNQEVKNKIKELNDNSDAIKQSLYNKVNDYRKKNGVKELIVDKRLERGSQRKAKDMADNAHFENQMYGTGEFFPSLFEYIDSAKGFFVQKIAYSTIDEMNPSNPYSVAEFLFNEMMKDSETKADIINEEVTGQYLSFAVGNPLEKGKGRNGVYFAYHGIVD